MIDTPDEQLIFAAKCERLGGRRCHRKDGDDFWEFTVNKFIIHIEPWFRRPPGRLRLGLHSAIGHEELGALVCKILGESPGTFQCMRFEQRFLDFSNCKDIGEDFARLLSSYLAEVRAMRLNDFIAEFRRSRPDRPSMPQLFHIASLAWVGDFGVLEEYLTAFRSGYRLNFVPMISAEMIDRAVEIAMDRYSGVSNV